MSNEHMREEFEEWVKTECVGQLDRNAFGNYRSTIVHAWWVGWQASRAALVVELPATMGLTRDTRRLVIEAIEAAGVRVKT